MGRGSIEEGITLVSTLILFSVRLVADFNLLSRIAQGLVYGRDRVFNNYSGNRPAEPSSVAVVATWHSLTRLLLQLVYIVRAACPGGRLLLPWETEHPPALDAVRSASASGDLTVQVSLAAED